MADPDGNAYGPFDVQVAGSYAESFTEEAWYRIHDESGVISGGALTFSGLTAQLAPILVMCHGSYLSRETTWSDASPATTGAQARRDLLVARRQLTAGVGDGAIPGKTFLIVLRGDPLATPVDPTPDPDNDTPLWSWQVPASGGTTVTGIKNLSTSYPPPLPYCQAKQDTTQIVAKDTWVKIAFDNETLDSSGMHSATTNNTRVTFQTAGVARIGGTVAFTDPGGSSTLRIQARLLKNGSPIDMGGADGPIIGGQGGSSVSTPTILIQHAPGDYVELQGFQPYTSAGGGLNTRVASDHRSSLTVECVRAL